MRTGHVIRRTSWDIQTMSAPLMAFIWKREEIWWQPQMLEEDPARAVHCCQALLSSHQMPLSHCRGHCRQIVTVAPQALSPEPSVTVKPLLEQSVKPSQQPPLFKLSIAVNKQESAGLSHCPLLQPLLPLSLLSSLPSSPPLSRPAEQVSAKLSC